MPSDRPSLDTPRRATPTLISELTGHLRPVRRIWRPESRLLSWLAIQSVVLLVAGVVLGVRSDAAARLGEGAFSAELVVLVIVGLVNAALALLAAVPGREPPRAAAIGALVVIFVGIGGAYASLPGSAGTLRELTAMGWPCAVRTGAVAAVPWLVLLIAVRRGATLVPTRAGVFAGVASLAFAAASLRLSCPLDERWHLLVWHLGPVAIGVGVSLIAGAAWLWRWRSQGRALEASSRTRTPPRAPK